MPRTLEEQALNERFINMYRRGQTTVVREIERAVFGSDYGGTSWATLREVDDIGDMLALRSGKRLLEVGAGSGWPGLYLAGRSGCDVTLADLPFEGLQIAAARALSDQIPGACWIVLADGGALPLAGESFDAVTHSDVLCCLDAKSRVFAECRRVIRPAGKMVFSVISIAAGLSSADHQRAVEAAPPYGDMDDVYPSLLEQTGWRIDEYVDLTAAYLESAKRRLAEDQAHEDGLVEILGEAEYGEWLNKDRNVVTAIEDGILRRELFDAGPAPGGNA